MKKILITLFTLLCAGQLYGMHRGMNEPEYGHYIFGPYMPADVKGVIISALNTYDNLNDVVYAIKASSLTNKELNKMINDRYGNQKGFTRLVHILLNKFPTYVDTSGIYGKEPKTVQTDGWIIAKFFNTPAAKEYMDLSDKLMKAVKKGSTIDEIIQLIKQGADINFIAAGMGYWLYDITIQYDQTTPIDCAIIFLQPEAVELLLNAGAKPKSIDYYDEHGYLPSRELNMSQEEAQKRKEQIKSLLEKYEEK